MSELKPCPNPWCESTDVGIESDSYDSPPVHYAVCNACGNTGPARDTEEAAADVWNARPKSKAMVNAVDAVPVKELETLRNHWLLDFHSRPCAHELKQLIDQAREASDE